MRMEDRKPAAWSALTIAGIVIGVSAVLGGAPDFGAFPETGGDVSTCAAAASKTRTTDARPSDPGDDRDPRVDLCGTGSGIGSAGLADSR